MNILGRFVASFSDFYKDINPATLSGAIDVVVEDSLGNLSFSPFSCTLWEIQNFQNTRQICECHCKWSICQRDTNEEAGEAFFVQETTD